MSKKKMIGAYPQTQDHASANTVSHLKMQAAVLPVEGITASLVATTSVTRQDSAAASVISAAAAVGKTPCPHTDVDLTGKATTTGRALPAAQVTAATAASELVSGKRQTRRLATTTTNTSKPQSRTKRSAPAVTAVSTQKAVALAAPQASAATPEAIAASATKATTTPAASHKTKVVAAAAPLGAVMTTQQMLALTATAGDTEAAAAAERQLKAQARPRRYEAAAAAVTTAPVSAPTTAVGNGLWQAVVNLFSGIGALGAQIKRTLWLFLPIFIGQLAATSMGVVDTVMAGAAGTMELSGVAIGSSIFWPSELFVVGLSLAIHPLVSNLVGAKNTGLVPQRLQVATIVCVLLAAFAGVVMVLVPFVYQLLPQVEPRMVSIGHGYLLAVGLAMPAYALFNVLRAYWEGLGTTLPTLFFGCMALLLNIPLNYIFIFGHVGMPALGGIGCGVATALTMYLTVGAMLLYVQLHPRFAEVRLFRRWYRVPLKDYWAFAKYALPLGVAGMVETLCFSLVSLLLSPFGPVVVASHTIAMNVSGLLVIVPLALSAVGSIEVGEAMGSNNWHKARQRALSTLVLAVGFYLIAVVTLLCGRDLIAAFYSDDAEVLVLAPVLMLYCVVFLLPDTLQLIASGVLRGFKDTRTIFVITVIAYWVVGMPIGLSLGYGFFTDAMEGAQGFWFGFICSLTCASVLLTWRLCYIFVRKYTPKSFKV